MCDDCHLTKNRAEFCNIWFGKRGGAITCVFAHSLRNARFRSGFLNRGPLTLQGGHEMLTRRPQLQDLFTIINYPSTIDSFMK